MFYRSEETNKNHNENFEILKINLIPYFWEMRASNLPISGKLFKETFKVLFMDQCPVHPWELSIQKHTQVICPLATCTIKLQPLHIGTLNSVIAKYRTDLARRMFISLEQKKNYMLLSSWNNVTAITVSNDF